MRSTEDRGFVRAAFRDPRPQRLKNTVGTGPESCKNVRMSPRTLWTSASCLDMNLGACLTRRIVAVVSDSGPSSREGHEADVGVVCLHLRARHIVLRPP